MNNIEVKYEITYYLEFPSRETVMRKTINITGPPTNKNRMKRVAKKMLKSATCNTEGNEIDILFNILKIEIKKLE